MDKEWERLYEEAMSVLNPHDVSNKMWVGSVALAWLTAQPFPTFPLVGASRVEHVEALREAGDAALTEKQRDFLRRVAAE